MHPENIEKDGMISLKEAGERFGYSADYVGQLIRKGKIDGVQVHANVAWMTTVAAMEEYVRKEKRGGKDLLSSGQSLGGLEAFAGRIFSGQGTPYYRYILRVLLFLLGVFAIFAFYLLSVSLDHYLAERAEQELLERKSETLKAGAGAYTASGLHTAYVPHQ